MTLENKILKHGPQTIKADGVKFTIEATLKGGYTYRGVGFRLRKGVWYCRRKVKGSTSKNGGFDKSTGTADLVTAVKICDELLKRHGADKGSAKIKALKALESARRNVRTVRDIFCLYWVLTTRKTKQAVLKDFLAASYIGQNKEAWPLASGSVAGQAGWKVLDIDQSNKKSIKISSKHSFVEALLDQSIEDAWRDEVVGQFKQITRLEADEAGESGSQEHELVLYNANARLNRAKALFTKALIASDGKFETYQLSDRERDAVKGANDVPVFECKYAVHYVPPADGSHGQKTWKLTFEEFLPFADSHLPQERNIFRSILLGFNGAFRNSEISKLKWSQIHGRLVTLNPGDRKNDKGNTVELSKRSLEQLLKLKDKKFVDNGVRVEAVIRESGYSRSVVQAVIKAHHRFELGLDKYLGQSITGWCGGYSKEAQDTILEAADTVGYIYCPHNGQRAASDGTENDDYVLEGTVYQRGEGNWNRVNEFLLGLGWKDPNGGQKVYYRLRKHLGSIVYSKLGVEAAAKLLGNTIAVCERHYAVYFNVIKNDWLDDLEGLNKCDNVIDVIDQVIAA